MGKERMNISLDAEIKKELLQYAEDNNTTVSALVTKWFANEKGLVRIDNKYIGLDEVEAKLAELNEIVGTMQGKKRRGFGQHSIVEIKKESEPAAR